MEDENKEVLYLNMWLMLLAISSEVTGFVPFSTVSKRLDFSFSQNFEKHLSRMFVLNEFYNF